MREDPEREAPRLMPIVISVGAGAGLGSVVGQGLRPHLGWAGAIAAGMIAGALAALLALALLERWRAQRARSR